MKGLLKLNSRRRLAADLVDNARNTLDLVANPVDNLLQPLSVEHERVCGHEVRSRHRTERDDVAVKSLIANDTDGTFFEAATVEELKQVYEDIGSSVGYTTEDQDISERFVGVGLVLLLGAGILSQLWFSRLP